MNRPVRSDDAMAIAWGLSLVPALERADCAALADDSPFFYAERARAALPQPTPAPRPNMLGVALTSLTALTIMAGGLAMACTTPVINGRTILGALLITAGGMLAVRLALVLR